jgi:RNA polymerase sigma-70 factor (ECF subfamily)
VTQGHDAQERSLESVALEHARELFRMAYCILRNAAGAEDAVQQTLLRACQAPRAAIVRNPRGWLATVVIHEALQMRRRQDRERRARSEGEAAPDRPDPQLLDHETGAVVRAALAELPEVTRAIVVLRVMRGYSGNEVAALLEIGPSQVSRRLYAGLDFLRIRLRNRCSELIEEQP